jgi:hypothetical protein
MNKKMVKMKKSLCLAILVMVLLPLSSAWGAPAGQDSKKTSKGGPLPSPNVDGLPEFLKLLVFARQNIAEGDFETALEHLRKAQKIHPHDPVMHELTALAYDGDRNGAKAFGHFLSAGELYFKHKNMDKAWKMLGWLKTIDAKSKKVAAFEEKIRKKQAELNKKKDKKRIKRKTNR